MKEKENGEKKGTLAGARTRALKFKVAPKLFGPAVRYVFFGENNIALYTGHARVTHGIRHAARLNLDDNVSQTVPAPGNRELWHAVPFSRRYVRMIKISTFRKIEDTWYKK